MAEELNQNMEAQAVSEAGAPAESAAEVQVKQRGKTGRQIPSGIAYVLATFNNTKVTFTDLHGNVLCWSTGGKNGFKGSRKSTPFAAQMAAEAAAKTAMEHGLRKVSVFVKGPGSGRETAIRSLQAAGLEIASIQDCTPIPHNGCRPRKRRRV